VGLDRPTDRLSAVSDIRHRRATELTFTRDLGHERIRSREREYAIEEGIDPECEHWKNQSSSLSWFERRNCHDIVTKDIT
jgi:hypothetical protein